MAAKRRQAESSRYLPICFAVVGLLVACGRTSPAAPPGSERGACYGNGTCDADLVCASGRCVRPDLCAAVTCSGHGTCHLLNGQPTCRCESGFHPVDNTCVPGCPSGSCATCPGDMVLLVGHDRCIDRYEASVYLQADCTEPVFGTSGWDNYPPGFPDLVMSSGCMGTCHGETVVSPTTEVYACSLPDVQPSAHVTWFQAKRACENVGKHLCTASEWRYGCEGPEATRYPYGDAFQPEACNGDGVYNAPEPTRSHVDCEGGFPGLFDMSGNVWEWVDTFHDQDTDAAFRAGGSFRLSPARLVCELFSNDSYYYLPPSASDLGLGFRCCL